MFEKCKEKLKQEEKGLYQDMHLKVQKDINKAKLITITVDENIIATIKMRNNCDSKS